MIIQQCFEINPYKTQDIISFNKNSDSWVCFMSENWLVFAVSDKYVYYYQSEGSMTILSFIGKN